MKRPDEFLIIKLFLNPRKQNFVVALATLLILTGGCVEKFIPETSEKKNLLIVDGLITDQYEAYQVKLSRSQPLGQKYKVEPVLGAQVFVKDDLGNSYFFDEQGNGIYSSDPSVFKGEIGRKYSLHVGARDTLWFMRYYESVPVELKPVPPIDSLYYEKINIKDGELPSDRIDNCQILLDTHDDSGNCTYFRWDFTETWEFHLHYEFPNYTCWITKSSSNIMVKNTTGLAKDFISRYPINYIPENSDRLEVRYSLLANQYSLSPDEYAYWDKLKNFADDVGGLYDMVAANIPGNITCISHPEEPVLGYFSVSGKASRRIFVKDNFAGQVNVYASCADGKVTNPGYIQGVGIWVWILDRCDFCNPPYVILTSDRNCVDCTTRGTLTRPDFWPTK